MYSLLKPILFKLSPEKAHDVMMSTLSIFSKNVVLHKILNYLYGNKIPELPISVMGLNFRHPVGLAAGLDKDARAFPAFSALGFSAVEMGTVTPLPQPGNPKPRMFRLEQDRAIINRMGFNSGGLQNFLLNFQPHQSSSHNPQGRTIAGINIGKNKITSNDNANEDYLKALRAVYAKADYVTVNISSPNTESLRELQGEEPLTELLKALSEERDKLAIEQNIRKPIALKIAPDLNKTEIKVISDLVIAYNFDALIATNTTVARPDSLQSSDKAEMGGLSGSVLKQASTDIIAEFYQHLKGKVPIIGVGGIETADDAWQKMLAGADYIQIYSGLIYHGPGMIREIVSGLKAKTNKYNSLNEALAAERAK
ncbi:MAG: quinone-dependent dihydroorotate dehydrogenase [Arenicella sp.]